MVKKVISSALALSLVFGGAAALPEGVGSMISNITADAVKQGDFPFLSCTGQKFRHADDPWLPGLPIQRYQNRRAVDFPPGT